RTYGNSSSSRRKAAERRQAAGSWDMVKLLVRDLRHDPVIFVPYSAVEKHSIEETAKEV
ncbi:hypothetical protein BGZ67_010563, partial [Mortierella alpina]